MDIILNEADKTDGPDANHRLPRQEPSEQLTPLPRLNVRVIAYGASGRPTLERKLMRLQRDILRMGALVEQSCLLAREALCDRNLASAKALKPHDKQIDQLYRQIEVDCVNLLNLEAPVTQDLRLVSTYMQVVRDLERIGDYAKDIAEAAIKLFPYPVHREMPQVQTMLDRCRAMVALCLKSLTELDAQSGYEIKEKDDLVDADYECLFESFARTPSDPTSSVEPLLLLVLVIRFLERIADHATNVGRRVTYVVTGERF
jgi:phosphate transport system protein